MLKLIKNILVKILLIRFILSVRYFSTYPSQLSLHTHLFSVHDRSIKETWTFQGFLSICKTYFKLQPVGWLGL